MLVRELMTTDVVTVDVDGTARDAVEALLDHDVGSVIVTSDEGHPVGLITETDTLRASYQSGRQFEDIEIREFADRPVVTTKPDSTVQFVAYQMAQEGVKKVPVMDDLDLVGIVTLTDIVWHLSEIRQEAMALEAAHKEWNPNR